MSLCAITFKYLQCQCHRFPVQSIPMFGNPFYEETFPDVWSKPPLLQIKDISSCPVACYKKGQKTLLQNLIFQRLTLPWQLGDAGDGTLPELGGSRFASSNFRYGVSLLLAMMVTCWDCFPVPFFSSPIPLSWRFHKSQCLRENIFHIFLLPWWASLLLFSWMKNCF